MTSVNQADNKMARRYGFARIGISTPDGNWEFGNNGIVNDEKPMPCSDEDSKDMIYTRAIFDFIKSDQRFDASRIWTEGFSQNSMFSAYIGFCFGVNGIYQGGSGMALTGQLPNLPGKFEFKIYFSFLEERLLNIFYSLSSTSIYVRFHRLQS